MAIVSIFIFNPFFNCFYHPTRPTVPTLSLCLPMLPYVISTISTFFPTLRTPTLLSLSFSSRPFTRYQEQDLLVVNFGLLRAISTISTILSGTWYFSNFFLLFFMSFYVVLPPPHSFLSVSLFKKRQDTCY